MQTNTTNIFDDFYGIEVAQLTLGMGNLPWLALSQSGSS